MNEFEIIKVLQKKKTNKNYSIRRLEDILFIIVVMQGMGAPGTFAGIIGSGMASVWYFINSLASLLLVCLCFVATAKRKKINRTILSVVLFCVYVVISGFFVSGFSIMVIEESLKLIFTIIIAMYIGAKHETDQIVDLLVAAQLIITVMILYLIAIQYSGVSVSDGYFEFNLIGLYTTKNSCGYELMFGGLLFYYKARKSEKVSSRVIWIIVCIIAIILTIYSRTIGAIATGIVATIGFEIILRKKNKINLSKLYIAINGGFWIFVYFILPSIGFLLKKIGRGITLTGRTNAWKAIIEFMQGGHAVFGYGYGGFWNNYDYTRSLYTVYGQLGVKSGLVGGHNLFMELYINIGIIGLLLFLIMVLCILKKTKDYNCANFKFPILCLLFLTIRGLMERTLNSITYDSIVLFLILGIVLKTTKKLQMK